MVKKYDIDDVKLAQLCLTLLGTIIVLKNPELANVTVPMIITAIGSLAGLKKGKEEGLPRGWHE